MWARNERFFLIFIQWIKIARILKRRERIRMWLCIPSTFPQSKPQDLGVGDVKKYSINLGTNFLHQQHDLLDVPWKTLYFSDSSLRWRRNWKWVNWFRLFRNVKTEEVEQSIQYIARCWSRTAGGHLKSLKINGRLTYCISVWNARTRWFAFDKIWWIVEYVDKIVKYSIRFYYLYDDGLLHFICDCELQKGFLAFI